MAFLAHVALHFLSCAACDSGPRRRMGYAAQHDCRLVNQSRPAGGPQMNNAEEANSSKPEDISAMGTGSKLETTKVPEDGHEDAKSAGPRATEAPASVEAIRQPVDANETPSPSQAREPRTDDPASSVAVKPVSVKKPQSFFAEQPLPIIEIAPWVLRCRTRRDLLLFGTGAVAAAAGAGFLLPRNTLGRFGRRQDATSRER